MGDAMATRYLKIIFVVLISLLCLFYGTQNVFNLEACYQAFAYVLGAVDHQVYANPVIPAIQSPVLIWLALVIVVGLEFTAGLFSAKGAWDLWNARLSPAGAFNNAKTYALIGCGLGIVIWLGLFAVLGGALFIMWQTDAGRGSLENSFQFFGACALIFMIVNAPDD
jgi:predicted small integral membrane protein